MTDLKLIAFDDEDLAVIAAHLQDAVLRVDDMAFVKSEQRFALVANRFDWSHAATQKPRDDFIRRRTGLRIEHVRSAQVQGLDLTSKDLVLSLLTLTFAPSGGDDDPRGTVTLTFAGGGAVRLAVDCVEAGMTDLGGAWSTPHKPGHVG